MTSVSHRRNNIVLGGVGVRVLRKDVDEEVERTMVFHHIFVSVSRTFGDYYRFSFIIRKIRNNVINVIPVGSKKERSINYTVYIYMF